MAIEDLIGVSRLLLQLHQFPGDLTGSRGHIGHHALQISNEAVDRMTNGIQFILALDRNASGQIRFA